MPTNPVEDVQTPTLTQLLQLVKDGSVARLNAASWGQVESYDEELQEATVQVVPRRVWVDATGTRQTERRAQLLDVPVLLPGSGDRGATFDVMPGDFVLLLFLDQAADGWFRTGGADADPGDPRRHSLSDAVAIPGLRPRTARVPTPPANLVLRDPALVQVGSASAAHSVLTDLDAGKLAGLMTDAGVLTALEAYVASIVTGFPARTAWIAAVNTYLSGVAPFGSAKVRADL